MCPAWRGGVSQTVLRSALNPCLQLLCHGWCCCGITTLCGTVPAGQVTQAPFTWACCMVCTLPPPSLPWQVVTLTISHFPATPVSWDVFYRLKYRYKWQPEALDQRTLKLDSSAWWREQYQRNIAVAGIPSKVPSGGGGGPPGVKGVAFFGAYFTSNF